MGHSRLTSCIALAKFRITSNPYKKAFIAYSALDRSHAFLVKRLLEEHNVKVWLDVLDIRVTGNIHTDLFSVIERQDLFCLLLSPKSVESDWVQKEIKIATDCPNLRILPIILRSCKIPTQLQDIIAFDAREGRDKPGVCQRFLQVLGGNTSMTVTLTQLELQLQNDKFLRDLAEQNLPGIKDTIKALSDKPILHIDLNIRPETLPSDANKFLELRFWVDTLFSGAMSFFVARYHEGCTWPEKCNFQEPDFHEFYLKPDSSRLDVQFRWFDRIQRLSPMAYDFDIYDHPATFTLDFGGEEFKPKIPLALPQVFQIPSLNSMVDNRSKFELLIHDRETGHVEAVQHNTDIVIDVEGRLGTYQAVSIYRSHSAPERQNILQIQELSASSINPILREVLLDRCCAILPLRAEKKPWREIEVAIRSNIEKNTFDSEDEMRLASYYLYDQGAKSFFYKQWKEDAYKFFLESTKILWQLIKSCKVPVLRDAETMYLATRRMTECWQQQNEISRAKIMAEAQIQITTRFRDADPGVADFQRMWAEASFVHATINAKLKKIDLALTDLSNYVRVRHLLYMKLKSRARRDDWQKAMSTALENAKMWGVSSENELIKEWTGLIDQVSLPTPNMSTGLPAWLKPCNPETWPTKPIRSVALRYSLRIPQQWSGEKDIVGTSMEHEHHYHGRRDEEWLRVSFMEEADETKDINGWVSMSIQLKHL